MQATRPDVEVPGDNQENRYYVSPYPVEVRKHTMARSGECLGMNEYQAVWRFGYTSFSERASQTGVCMEDHFLWVLADRRSGKVDETFTGIAINLPERFRNVLEWGDQMKTYKFIITLYDSGLPYPSIGSAKTAAEEWAHEIATTENCQVANVQVDEEE